MHSPLVRAGAFALVLLSAVVGMAAPPPLVVSEAGYFWMTVDESGRPTLLPVETVVDLTGGNAPTPPDDGGGDSLPFDGDLVDALKPCAVDVGDPLGAQAIATVYAQLRDAVHDGTMKAQAGLDALAEATDIALEQIDEPGAWRPFRDKVEAKLNEGLQRGTLQTDRQVVIFLNSVSIALEQAADGSEALALNKAVAIASKVNEVIHAQD